MTLEELNDISLDELQYVGYTQYGNISQYDLYFVYKEYYMQVCFDNKKLETIFFEDITFDILSTSMKYSEYKSKNIKEIICYDLTFSLRDIPKLYTILKKYKHKHENLLETYDSVMLVVKSIIRQNKIKKIFNENR